MLAVNGWKIISATRDATKRQIENIRKEDIIELGDDLEAKVHISIISSKNENVASNAFLLFNNDLEDIFGTSQVTVEYKNIANMSDAAESNSTAYSEVVNISNEVNIVVVVDQADGDKCLRCWKYSPSVEEVDLEQVIISDDSDDNDSMVPLCPRCKEIVCGC